MPPTRLHHLTTRRARILASVGAGALLASGLALASPAGSPGSGAAAAAPSLADRQRLADRFFKAEPAPALGAADAVALAAAPAGVDPVRFNRGSLRTATRTRVTHPLAWRQIGPNGSLINSPDYAEDGGRLPTAGIVLAIAVDPTVKSGRIAYAATGGGLWKTSNAGRTWRRAKAIPAVPVAAVAVDPKNHRNVYAVTGQGFQGGGEYPGLGAYYSHNAGRTWHPAKSSVHGAGQQVAVGPDGAVFAATTGGLFRSGDHGKHYRNVLLPTDPATGKPAKGTPVGSWTSDVVIRPVKNGGKPYYEVFAAVGYVAGNVTITNPDGSTTPAAPGNGLYVSSKRGRVGTFKVDQGVYSKTSGWEQQAGHISNDPIGRTRLVWTPDGKYLFALVADAGHRSSGNFGPTDSLNPTGLPHPTSLNGVYRSADDGQTWDEIATSESLAPAPGSSQGVLSAASALGYNPGIQAWYNGWIAFDPNGNRLLLGEEEVYQSQADATATASPAAGTGGGYKPLGFDSIDAYVSACGIVTTGLTPPGSCDPNAPSYGGQVTHPDQHAAFLVNQGGGKSRLWIGNDGGVFRQDHAAGAQFKNGAWKSEAHMQNLLPYRAVMGSNGEVIAGLQDNGTNLWPPKSQNSYEICGGDGTWVGVDKTNPNVFYCNANGYLYVTTNGGKSTSDITPCPANGTCGNPTFAPAATSMDPFNSNHIVLATNAVYETTKGPYTNPGDGASDTGDWQNVFNLGKQAGVDRVAEAVDVEGTTTYVGGCAVCASSVKAPIKATDRALATNVGGTWHFAKLKGMPRREISALAADPNNTKRVYIATAVPSVIRVDFGGSKAPRILMSRDGGNHVRNVSGNLPRGNVWDVKVAHGRAYAATDYGVFTSKVGSKVWKRLGKRLPVVRVFGLNFSADRKKLVAATYGAGVWVFPLKRAHLSAALPKRH